jgi:ankyrin repeat protein
MEVFHLLLDAHARTGTMSSVLPVVTSSGDLEMFKSILSNTLHTKEGLSACLLTAAKSGAPEIVGYILDTGADVNYYTSSCPAAIHEAVASVNIVITRILIDAGAHLNLACGLDLFNLGHPAMVRPLAIAAFRGDLALIHLLHSRGALADYEPNCNHNEITPLDAAISTSKPSRRVDIIQALLEAGVDINREIRRGELPLNVAIERRKPELVSLFLKWGADVNKSDKLGMTALQWAARVDDLGLMKSLLHAGASASINSLSSKHYIYNSTALQWAAWHANQNAVALLLQHGADCNVAAAPDSGVTALQSAAIEGSMPISVLLLEAGAEINAPAARIYGRTALEGAAEHGNLQIVLLLLENDPDRDGLEARCKRAAKYAEDEYPIIAKVLKEYKAV